MAQNQTRRELWVDVLFVLLLAIGLAIIGLGAREALLEDQYLLLAIGALCMVVPASVYPLVVQARSRTIEQQLDAHREMLEQIDGQLKISEQAKRIAYRRKDRALLRQTIDEEVGRGDYEVALALVEEMGQAFGAVQEAEELRQNIERVRKQQRQTLAHDAVAHVGRLIEDHQWETARREADRYQRLCPDVPSVQELPRQIEQAREEQKHELERAFLEAARTDDVERAMELMTELDKYLTPEEAQPYLETARGVIGRKRENLGVRFKIAVQDREWVDAVNTGEQILRDFPNTKMAEEVRSILDTLRERAAKQREASEGVAV